MARGADFQDAYLALGIDTLPPSLELRRERQERHGTGADAAQGASGVEGK